MIVDKTKREYEKFSYLASSVVFILVLLFSSAYLFINEIRFLDYYLVSVVLTVSVGLSTLGVSLAGFYKQRKTKSFFKSWKGLFFSIVTSVALGFTFAVFGHLSTLLITAGFKDIPYMVVGTSFLAGGLSSFVALFVADYIYDINQKRFSMVILMAFMSGFFVSAVNSLDYTWWRWSICSLGMPMNGTQAYYNFTMILTGILILALGLYYNPQIKKITEAGLLTIKASKRLTVLYYIEAVVVALVGMFPYGVSYVLDYIHVFFGYYAFAHVGLIILFSPWLFGKFPKRFFVQSYWIIATAMVFYFSNLYFLIVPPAIAEIISIIATVIWIMLLTRTLRTLSESA
jgi:hypothetical membrane protein